MKIGERDDKGQERVGERGGDDAIRNLVMELMVENVNGFAKKGITFGFEKFINYVH